MGIPRSLRAAALVAAAVLMGLLTVQGTYALWAANASVTPGSVSAASFNVSLTGMPSGQVTNMTLAGGQPASLALTTQSVPSGSAGPGLRGSLQRFCQEQFRRRWAVQHQRHRRCPGSHERGRGISGTVFDGEREDRGGFG